MKDKVMFFLLGAVLATIAYFVGDLETLTAEDGYREIDALRVNRLHVKDGIGVGDIGKKYIMIKTDNEWAQISLYGAEMPENSDDLNLGDTPVISLVAGGDSAVIRAKSHSKRPEAICVLGVMSPEGKYKSSLIIQDLDGTNGVLSDGN